MISNNPADRGPETKKSDGNYRHFLKIYPEGSAAVHGDQKLLV